MIRAATRLPSNPAFALHSVTYAPLLVAGGAICVAVSAFLPWVVVFGGLQSVRGIDVPVVLLAEGASALALAAWVLGHREGKPRALWLLAVIAGVASVAYGALEVQRLVSFLSSPGPTGALLEPVAGPGAPLFVLGSLLMVAGIAMTGSRRIRVSFVVRRNGVLALALFGAGWIHLTLTHQHINESALLGLGFGLAALAQLALSAAAIRAPRNSIYLLIVAINIGLIVLYAYNAAVGLPLGDSGHDHGGGLVSFSIGHGEPIDLYGIVCEVLQVLAIVIAFLHLSPTQPPSPAYHLGSHPE